jgi:hypothetical protein
MLHIVAMLLEALEVAVMPPARPAATGVPLSPDRAVTRPLPVPTDCRRRTTVLGVVQPVPVCDLSAQYDNNHPPEGGTVMLGV